jgi:hypothetical protein
MNTIPDQLSLVQFLLLCCCIGALHLVVRLQRNRHCIITVLDPLATHFKDQQAEPCGETSEKDIVLSQFWTLLPPSLKASKLNLMVRLQRNRHCIITVLDPLATQFKGQQANNIRAYVVI